MPANDYMESKIDLERLTKQLTIDEGVRYKPYRDTVGKLTIGVGRNLDDVGLFPNEVTLMLEHDIARSEHELETNLPWFRKLTPLRQEVLINMCFNLGWPKLSQFKITLKLIEGGLYAEAAKAMLQSKWATQVGQRAIRLAAQMEKGA